MTAEDFLFHGKITEDGYRVLEYPSYEIVQLSNRQWNVLCGLKGDSGYRETKSQCQDWVNRNIKFYVKLEDHEKTKKELARVKAQLTEVELRLTEMGYDTIEEFLLSRVQV